MGSSYQIQDQSAIYFATFQVVGWADVFTRVRYKEIIIESFKYCQQQKNLELYAYVIMSNHVHCILRSTTGELSQLVHDFKRFTAREIMSEIDNSAQESRKRWLNMVFGYYAKYNKRASEKQFWTHENHFVALETAEMIQSRLEYIHLNPVRAGWVYEPEHYVFSSASNYAGMDSVLNVTLL